MSFTHKTLSFLIGALLLSVASCDFKKIGSISGAALSNSFLTLNVPPAFTVTEGDASSVLLSLSKPAPQSFTLRWTIDGTADFRLRISSTNGVFHCDSGLYNFNYVTVQNNQVTEYRSYNPLSSISITVLDAESFELRLRTETHVMRLRK